MNSTNLPLMVKKANELLTLCDEDETLDICIGAKMHCLDVAILADDKELFTKLLEKGANPLCAIKGIMKNLDFLEILLSKTEGGTGISTELFPYTATKLIASRGKKRTALHKLLLRYDFPVSRDGNWREQTKMECYMNDNAVGFERLKD